MRVLIIALDTVLAAEVPDAEVLVVAPALNSRLRHWVSDEAAARREAKERAAGFVEGWDNAEFTPRVESATPIRCWRSRMHCGRSRPTRS